ncbi:DUF448 domain-containing protein [Novosphingobium sp. 9U]|uniref:DUF448 domain-containing protein n=1 Tax=Novosphingobium sp. 9U TaxID=2653158 RepID=UPI0012F18A48|nr:DUF448 domain-containing protein [Novosphingobium sp. 9U]VWX46821.1 Nucleic-acid-binding protein [Novosphingobium sp. 9U]
MRIPHNDRLGSDSSREGPERTCILSGEAAPRDALIRLAVSPPGPDGACVVLPDVHARAPGRGAWIGVSRQDLEKAQAKGKLKGALLRAFGKSLDGTPLTIPEDLAERIDTALVRAFTDRLGLETKSGRLLVGSDRIAENARNGKVRWLAHAADAAEDGSRKLDQAWRVGSDAEGSGLRGTVLPLDRAALSVALGRDNVVHLALADSKAAERVAAPLQRLLHFRGQAVAAGTEADGGQGPAQAAPSAATTN